MTDTPNGQESTDEGKQPVAVPTTEKPAEVSAPPTEEARPAEPEGKLPEEVKERTRLEFEKLKETNKRLSKENYELRAIKTPQPKRQSALDVFAPQEEQLVVPQQTFNPTFGPQMPVKPQVEEFKPIVPDENGLIDMNALNQRDREYHERLRRLENEARQAKEQALKAQNRVAKYEHTDKTLKTYAVHPYLDPTNPAFDEKFSDLVRKELLDQMVNQGKEDYLAAANRVKAEYYDPTVKPKVETDPKQIENVTKRDQINALSGTKRDANEPEQDILVQESRQGSRDAVYQRLKKSGY